MEINWKSVSKRLNFIVGLINNKKPQIISEDILQILKLSDKVEKELNPNGDYQMKNFEDDILSQIHNPNNGYTNGNNPNNPHVEMYDTNIVHQEIRNTENNNNIADNDTMDSSIEQQTKIESNLITSPLIPQLFVPNPIIVRPTFEMENEIVRYDRNEYTKAMNALVDLYNNLEEYFKSIPENLNTYNLKDFEDAIPKQEIEEEIMNQLASFETDGRSVNLVNIINSVRQGYYFAFWKLQHKLLDKEKNKKKPKLHDYIKEKTKTKYEEASVKTKIKLYSIFCRCKHFIFLCSFDKNYSTSFFERPNGTRFLEILQENGKMLNTINQKQLPEHLLKKLPPKRENLMFSDNIIISNKRKRKNK